MTDPLRQSIRLTDVRPGDHLFIEGREEPRRVTQIDLIPATDDGDREMALYAFAGSDQMHSTVARIGGWHEVVEIVPREGEDRVVTSIRRRRQTKDEVSVLDSTEAGDPDLSNPYLRSQVVAERILRLPAEDARAEVATVLRALWDYQRRGGHPTYPTQATRQRWAKTRERLQSRAQ